MAAFNPKPWFKQPIGTKISFNKRYNPYSDEWNDKKVRIPIAIKENTKSSYENISYSYEIFNEVIVWGLMNYPELRDFFGKNIEIHGTKVSFDKNIFQKVSKDKQFIKLEDVKRNMNIYKRLSYTQKLISNLINDFDKYKGKKYTPICKRKKTKGRKNYEIINYSANKSGGGGRKKKKKSKTRRKKKTIRKNDDKCILYYFTMNGCPYCNDFNPHWEKVVKSFSKITMEKIERNEDPKKVRSFNVISFPTIILVNGKKRVEFTKDRENMDDFREFFKENGVKIV